MNFTRSWKTKKVLLAVVFLLSMGMLTAGAAYGGASWGDFEKSFQYELEDGHPVLLAALTPGEAWIASILAGDHTPNFDTEVVNAVLSPLAEGYCVEGAVDRVLARGWEATFAILDYDDNNEHHYFGVDHYHGSLESHQDILFEKERPLRSTLYRVVRFWGPESAENFGAVSIEGYVMTEEGLVPEGELGVARDYCGN